MDKTIEKVALTSLLDQAKIFFADPENQIKYEAWLKRKEHKNADHDHNQH